MNQRPRPQIPGAFCFSPPSLLTISQNTFSDVEPLIALFLRFAEVIIQNLRSLGLIHYRFIQQSPNPFTLFGSDLRILQQAFDRDDLFGAGGFGLTIAIVAIHLECFFRFRVIVIIFVIRANNPLLDFCDENAGRDFFQLGFVQAGAVHLTVQIHDFPVSGQPQTLKIVMRVVHVFTLLSN